MRGSTYARIKKNMKFLVMSGVSFLLVLSGAFFVPHAFGQTSQAADFSTAVKTESQSAAKDPHALAVQQETADQEYASAWDEFGRSILIDGAIAPTEVERSIMADLVRIVETEASYSQQEAAYLHNIQATPEEIQTAEAADGSDIPSGETINPNPSAQKNPEAHLFVIEDQEQPQAPEDAADVASTTDEIPASTTPETESSVSPETETQTSGDEVIFEAILQGEQHMVESSPGPAQEPDQTQTTEPAPTPPEAPPMQEP